MARPKETPVIVEPLERRTLLSASLAAELNPGTAGIGPGWSDQPARVRTHDRVYYMANDGRPR